MFNDLNQENGHVLSDITNQVNGGIHDGGDAKIGEENLGGENTIDPAKLKISYENYKRLTNMLVIHMRANEEKHADEEDWEGIKQSMLVEWLVFF